MIKGTGIDIVKIERMQKAILKENFVRRVFSTSEQEYCISKNRQAAYSYAARFAAKEAFVKALGTGFVAGKLTDIEVVNDLQGKPTLVLGGLFREIKKKKKIENIHLSLSHTAEYAMAQVILEG